jgi:hypothetical protein
MSEEFISSNMTMVIQVTPLDAKYPKKRNPRFLHQSAYENT